jgi:molybdopterin/thiamine biosynthesis adenylyltransferase
MGFTRDELVRYSRQMVLPQIGGLGQARLREARAVARGEIEALYLAAAGVGTIVVPSEEIAAQVRALNPLVTVVAGGETGAAGSVSEQCKRAVATLKELLAL